LVLLVHHLFLHLDVQCLVDYEAVEAPVHHFQLLPQPASHLDSTRYYFVFERHAK